MNIWVTRDKVNERLFTVAVWSTKPVLIHGRYESHITDELKEIHTPKSFKHQYGFTPRKGACKKYEHNLTEVE